MKFLLALLVLAGVAFLVVGLEQYSAGRRLEEFLNRTRQITTGMTEEAVIRTLGEPSERSGVRRDPLGHEVCHQAGATKVLSYRFE